MGVATVELTVGVEEEAREERGWGV